MDTKPNTLGATDTERQSDDTLWKTKDVADFLKVSTQTVRKLVERDAIPYVRIAPNTIRYDPSVIRRWVLDQHEAA